MLNYKDVLQLFCKLKKKSNPNNTGFDRRINFVFTFSSYCEIIMSFSCFFLESTTTEMWDIKNCRHPSFRWWSYFGKRFSFLCYIRPEKVKPAKVQWTRRVKQEKKWDKNPLESEKLCWRADEKLHRSHENHMFVKIPRCTWTSLNQILSNASCCVWLHDNDWCFPFQLLPPKKNPLASVSPHPLAINVFKVTQSVF